MKYVFFSAFVTGVLALLALEHAFAGERWLFCGDMFFLVTNLAVLIRYIRKHEK